MESDQLASFLGAPLNHTRQLLIIHLNLVIYALAFWLCQPVLPFLSKKLGADPVMMGLLDTTFSVVQLIGGPLMGRLCDTQGARNTIMIAQISGAMVYGLQSCAYNVTILFASKVPAVFQHCMIGAQAAVTDLALSQSRALAMGRLSLSYGVGMVVGSSLGGYIADKYGHSAVAVLAAGLSLGVAAVTAYTLPALKHDKEHQKEASEPPADSVSSKYGLHLLANSALLAILLLRFLVGLGLAVQRSTFKFVAADIFDISVADLGYLMSYSALMSLLANVLIVGWATRAFGDERALQVSTVILAVSFVFYASATTLSSLLLIFIPMIVASTLLYTIASSVSTKCVDPADTGASIGLSHGMQTLTGVISPTVGGYLYTTHGYQFLGMFCAACCAAAFIFSIFGLQPHPLVLKQKKK